MLLLHPGWAYFDNCLISLYLHGQGINKLLNLNQFIKAADLIHELKDIFI